jgi:DNA-binding CsgD family transcriptional regulator
MTFKTICNIAATLRCLSNGQSIDQIAVSAKVSPETVRKWIRQGGYKRIAMNGKTKYVFGS